VSGLKKPTLKVRHMHGKKLLHWRKTQIGIVLCRQKEHTKCVLPSVRSEKINVERETDTSIVLSSLGNGCVGDKLLKKKHASEL